MERGTCVSEWRLTKRGNSCATRTKLLAGKRNDQSASTLEHDHMLEHVCLDRHHIRGAQCIVVRVLAACNANMDVAQS